MRWLVVLLLVPGVAAGPVTIGDIMAPAYPIKPDQETLPLEVPIHIDCNAALEWTGHGLLADRINIAITFDRPDHVIITGPGSVSIVVTPQSCLEQSTLSTSPQFRIAATREAPGLEPLQVEVTATATVDTVQGRRGDTGTATFDVQSDYFPLLRIQVVDNVVVVPRGNQATAELEVQNFGNARTTVTFRLANDLEGWDIVLPAPLVLDSPATGGRTSETAVVHVASSEHRVQAVVQVIATPAATADANKIGNPQTGSILLRTEDYRAVLGIQPAEAQAGEQAGSKDAPLPLVPVAALAFAALRRRA